MQYQSENKTCQNCKNDFIIESDDFSFYDKIKVPPPTFCPECRMIRRMAWRNVRSLHKRNCHICDKSLISMYREITPVLCTDCYFGDKFDPFQYGFEYNYLENFFIQLKRLFLLTPKYYSYKAGNIVNSEFSNYTVDNKNVYLAYSVIGCEDVMYSETIENSKNTLDSYAVQKVDNVYENIDCEGNFNTYFSIKTQNCLDSFFLYDCSNCSNCFMSSNLRNQSYYFYNQKLSREKYLEAMAELEMNKYFNLEKLKEVFKDLIKNKTIHKYGQIISSENVSGNYIFNSKNIDKSFDIWDSENVKYSMRTTQNVKDSYDLQGTGRNAELIYEALASSINTYKNSFVYITLTCKETEYSLNLKNCSNCFGCVGLTNAQYCIFNKQYSKEEYFEMVEKIKKHMNDMPYIDSKGRIFKYGEFFPYDMSPFGYNETNAHDFFPISKEESIDKGYNWYDRESRDYNPTILSKDLPDDINEVDESILKEIIACPNNGDALTQCTTAFRIVPNELQFYKQKNLPLPRYCPNCRHYERLKYRNPIKLWHRKCMKEGCTNEFETSYSPDRPEIVYCEKCYQQEVY